MHKSFTLIEVIVAVVILALVGVALLKNGNNGIDFLQKISQKDSTIDTVLIVANHRNLSFNHLQKSLEDYLQTSYSIDDMEVQKIVKSKKFKYLETYPKIDLPVLEGFEEENQDNAEEENAFPLQIVKISIMGKKDSSYLYMLELNE